MPAPTIAELLDFEAAHPKHTGRKETRIRDELHTTPARYYQLLHRAADTQEGQAHNPTTARIIRARHTRTPERPTP